MAKDKMCKVVVRTALLAVRFVLCGMWQDTIKNNKFWKTS